MVESPSLSTRFDAFSHGAILDVSLPWKLDFDAATLLKDGTLEAINAALSRRNLFFGVCYLLSQRTRLTET